MPHIVLINISNKIVDRYFYLNSLKNHQQWILDLKNPAYSFVLFNTPFFYNVIIVNKYVFNTSSYIDQPLRNEYGIPIK